MNSRACTAARYGLKSAFAALLFAMRDGVKLHTIILMSV
jgi:hypothetical protein